MTTPTNVVWFTSSHSTNNGDCVECARLPGRIAVRDSKDPSGPVLVFTAPAWSGFLAALACGTTTDL